MKKLVLLVTAAFLFTGAAFAFNCDNCKKGGGKECKKECGKECKDHEKKDAKTTKTATTTKATTTKPKA